jgi:hypothetical protein
MPQLLPGHIPSRRLLLLLLQTPVSPAALLPPPNQRRAAASIPVNCADLSAAAAAAVPDATATAGSGLGPSSCMASGMAGSAGGAATGAYLGAQAQGGCSVIHDTHAYKHTAVLCWHRATAGTRGRRGGGGTRPLVQQQVQTLTVCIAGVTGACYLACVLRSRGSTAGHTHHSC